MSDLLAANHIVELRVVEKTKGNYRGKIRQIIKYLNLTTQSKNRWIRGNEIRIPLSDAIIKQLFGYLSMNTDLPKKKRGIRRLREDEHVEQNVQVNVQVEQDEQIEHDDDDDDEEEEDNNDIDESANHDTTSSSISFVNNSVEEGTVFATNEITISHSCMQGYKSALGWYYRERNQELSHTISRWIDDFIKGYKKSIADKKSRGVMCITEGKSPLSFGGFARVCIYFVSFANSTTHLTWQLIMFGWLFMVLCWNLIGRSASVGNIMLQHIDWSEDCLKIKLAKHKGDQTGEGLGNEKHIYANPLNPSICTILALAVYIFCKHRGTNVTKQQLFDGSDSEGRFSKLLNKILESIAKESPNTDLGAEITDLGTHSNRKGAATYLLGIFMLSAVNVYLRAGWSLGNVQDRYIFAGSGGDQIVGRAISGLPLTDMRFATLPPYFSNEDLEILNTIGLSKSL